MSLKLIKFSAVWCPPCKVLQPVWEQLVDEIHDVEFESVDIDKEPKLATQYKISAVPTIVFIKNGTKMDSMVGVRSAADIKARIDSLK